MTVVTYQVWGNRWLPSPFGNAGTPSLSLPAAFGPGPPFLRDIGVARSSGARGSHGHPHAHSHPWKPATRRAGFPVSARCISSPSRKPPMPPAHGHQAQRPQSRRKRKSGSVGGGARSSVRCGLKQRPQRLGRGTRSDPATPPAPWKRSPLLSSKTSHGFISHGLRSQRQASSSLASCAPAQSRRRSLLGTSLAVQWLRVCAADPDIDAATAMMLLNTPPEIQAGFPPGVIQNGTRVLSRGLFPGVRPLPVTPIGMAAVRNGLPGCRLRTESEPACGSPVVSGDPKEDHTYSSAKAAAARSASPASDSTGDGGPAPAHKKRPPAAKARKVPSDTLPLKKRRTEKPPESDDEEMKEAAGSLLHLAGIRSCLNNITNRTATGQKEQKETAKN
nr:uncharacterized protein LOC110145747 [Odocoileus virginianus texanus]